MSTRRRVLMAWRAAAVAIVAEREAEVFYQQRAREAQLEVLAARFNRIRVLHPVLHSWSAAAVAAAATRAAATAEAAREAEAREKRMVIAARFHKHCRHHGVLRAWRGAVAAGKAERLEEQQQQQMTSRIDAVLSRVRAAQREGRMRSSAAGQQPPRPQTAGGGSTASAKSTAAGPAAPRPQSAGRGARRPPPASPRSRLTAAPSQSGARRSSTPQGAVCRPGSGRGDGRVQPGRQWPPVTPRGCTGAPPDETVDPPGSAYACGSPGGGGEQAAGERAWESVVAACDGASTDGPGSVDVHEACVQGAEGGEVLPCASGVGEAVAAHPGDSRTAVSSSSGCEAAHAGQHGSADASRYQLCMDDYHGSGGSLSSDPGVGQAVGSEAPPRQPLSRLPPRPAAQEPDAGVTPRSGAPPVPHPGPCGGSHAGAVAMQSSDDHEAAGGVVDRENGHLNSVGGEPDTAIGPFEAIPTGLWPAGTGQQGALSKVDAVTQSWDSYVDFLKQEVISRPDQDDTAPADVAEPAPVAAQPAKSILPIQTFSRLRGRQAQEELDAQLARVQAATGAPLCCRLCLLGPSHLPHRP